MLEDGHNPFVRQKTGDIIFKDYPDFRPNLTPEEIFRQGAFGGTYWRPISSGVTGKSYKDAHLEFPKKWWADIPDDMLISPTCNPSVNKYRDTSGTSLRFWESKKWIRDQDPYGWVQWYSRFYRGRRSPDDVRQINRWKAFAGPKGRFRRWLVNLVKKRGTTYDDVTVSPKIRQGLHQWAYELTKKDYTDALKNLPHGV